MINNISLLEGEHLDDLLIEGRKIIQNKNLYMFTSDSVRLADYVNVKSSDKICELCSGSGIISILLALKKMPKEIKLVEIQPELASMSERSIKMNGFEECLKVINAPLQNISSEIGQGNYSVVVCNPPFEKTIINIQNRSQQIARSEVTVTFSEIALEASRLLKYGGAFYLCIPATRFAEVCAELNKNHLEVKETTFLLSKDDSCRLALLKAVKGGKSEVKIKAIKE